MAEDGARYQLGPRSRRGLVAGWRGGQLITVGLGLVVGLLVVRCVGGGAGALLAFGVVAASVAFVTWPFAGRSAEQWAPVVVAHLARRSGVSRRGRGALASLELDEVPIADSQRKIGVVRDSLAGTCTAVMRVGGSGFALGDDAERARHIAAWSSVLAGSAREGGALHRLQWVARCLPGGFQERAVPAQIVDRGIAAESYRALLDRADPVLWRHEVLLAVSVRCASGPAKRRSRGIAGNLVEELDALQRRCTAAGLDVEGVLSPGALAATIRSTSMVAGAPEGVADSWPWPLGIEENWSQLRTDATWHAVYWIAEWPRSQVGSGFMLPMMLEGSLRRTIAVTMAPVAPLRAVRRAEHDRTSGVADATFCHPALFVCGASSLEGALALARKAVEA